MAGATDVFFTLLMACIASAIVLGVVILGIIKIGDWQYDRQVKKVRAWLLPLFDQQLAYIMDPQNNGCYAKNPAQKKREFAELRESLSMMLSYMSDIIAFKKKGAPLLLVFSQDGDAEPYILLGISDFSDEVKLSEYSVLGQQPWPRKERAALNGHEELWLKVFYGNLASRGNILNYCSRLDVPEKEVDERARTSADKQK